MQSSLYLRRDDSLAESVVFPSIYTALPILGIHSQVDETAEVETHEEVEEQIMTECKRQKAGSDQLVDLHRGDIDLLSGAWYNLSVF